MIRVRLRSAIRRTARRVAYSTRVRALIMGAALSNLPADDIYVSPEGRRFQRYKGYRDALVPRWQGMFDSPEDRSPGLGDIPRIRTVIDELRSLVEVYGGKFGDVMDVGCDAGLHAYAIAEAGARSVTGIDMPEYGIRQTTGMTVERQSHMLTRLRSEVASGFGIAGNSVAFRNAAVEEIADEEAFDLILSWETLEHIARPNVAFERMAAALRPGGLSFHEYNPFFALNGGHSLCSLDFNWGHARLDSLEFDDYLKRYRPAEVEVANRFFHESLNRMTLAHLGKYIQAAGLEMLMLAPWPDREHVNLLSAEVLAEVQSLYPSAKALDLVSPTVWLLVRRPA